MIPINRQYDRDPHEALTLKVVGIGGAGSNILDRVMLDGIESADLVAINTDVQSLTASVAAHKVQLGRNLTRGLGSGGDPEVGLAAAEEAVDEIRSVLQGGAVIFLCTGLGGGTGSGAAPIVAQLAKEENALVLVFAALPFSFEGRRRCAQAEESLERLRSAADAVVCFENDRMAEITLPRMGIHEAFGAADLTISQSIRSVATLLQHPGLLHIGFDDICSVLRHGDARGLFGYGDADGENRAHDALARALKNPLMNRGALLEEAFNAIVHICGGPNMTLGEVQIIMEELNRHVNDRTQLFMGIGVDPRMGNRLSVSILSSLGEETKRSKVQPIPRRSDDLLERNSESLSDLASPAPKPSRSRLRAAAEPVPAQGPVAEAPPQKIVAPTPVQPVEQPIEQVFAQEGEGSQRVPKPDPKPKPPPTKKPEAKQETLQFEPVSRGRFEKSEPTIIDGQDLDVPTFLRKGVPKNR
jgi:cell division protein FtsZ